MRSIVTYVRNLAKGAWFLIVRPTRVKDIVRQAWHDTQKLAHKFGKPSERTGNRRLATRLTEKGREAYNIKRYETAEQSFRQAILADRGYALAYVYLGHALYKMGKLSQAVTYWNQAIQAAPDSDAARIARRKIEHLERAKDRALTEIEDWLR